MPVINVRICYRHKSWVAWCKITFNQTQSTYYSLIGFIDRTFSDTMLFIFDISGFQNLPQISKNFLIYRINSPVSMCVKWTGFKRKAQETKIGSERSVPNGLLVVAPIYSHNTPLRGVSVMDSHDIFTKCPNFF